MRFSIFTGALIIAMAINPTGEYSALGWVSVGLLFFDFVDWIKNLNNK